MTSALFELYCLDMKGLSMIGTRKGKWLVIDIVLEELPNGKRRHTFIKAKCDCGIEKLIYPGNWKLTNGCSACFSASLVQAMIGRRFSKFTVISLSHSNGNNYFYNCRCDCGKERVCDGSGLRRGKILRCSDCKALIHKKHGMKGTSTYNIWNGMLFRCFNPKSRAYKNYGGRGIAMCDRWLKFEGFLEDMGARPEGLQIDRIDNDKGYSKENCRWVTPKQNCENRKRKSIDE